MIVSLGQIGGFSQAYVVDPRPWKCGLIFLLTGRAAGAGREIWLVPVPGMRSKGPPAVDLNWLTPKAEASPAGPKGWGSFALEPITEGETVAGFGGHVVPRAVLDSLPEDRQGRSIQIDTNLYLVSAETPEPGDMLNHSCEPSLGLVGATVLVALRDIEVGEELTFDYATCDCSDYDEFVCLCGEPTCRGTITGMDWLNPELQVKYAGWFSPYLQRRIAELPSRLRP